MSTLQLWLTRNGDDLISPLLLELQNIMELFGRIKAMLGPKLEKLVTLSSTYSARLDYIY